MGDTPITTSTGITASPSVSRKSASVRTSSSNLKIDVQRPWLVGYGYRRKLNIVGSSDGVQTNYPMKLTIHSGSGTTSGSTIYLDSNSGNFPYDIAFTQGDGETLLDFWIEDTGVDPISAWVEFNSIAASPSSTTFYIYYGLSITAESPTKSEISASGLRASAYNTCPFTSEHVWTYNGVQYAVFIDSSNNVVAAKRTLPDGAWSTQDTGSDVDGDDAHGSPNLGIDPNGYIHLMFNFHADGISGRYIVSTNSEDISAWTSKSQMTGSNEDSVTYPTFFNDGSYLYFLYRNGASGNGNLYLNKYDHSTTTWSAVQHPLIRGRWALPTGHISESGWTNEANAYDDNTSNNSGCPSTGAGEWGPYLELTHNATNCGYVRYWPAPNTYFTNVDVDAYYSGAYHDVYEGTFDPEEWNYQSLGATYSVTKWRIRFQNTSGGAHTFFMREFQFHDEYASQPPSRSPYWNRIAIETTGTFHLFWCWRETTGWNTNEKVCYAYTSDGGSTWKESDDSSYTLPITYLTSEVVDDVAQDTALINQHDTCVDSDGYPHTAYWKEDSNGRRNIFHTWFNGSSWATNQVTTFEGLETLGRIAILANETDIIILFNYPLYTGKLYAALASSTYSSWVFYKIGTDDWSGTPHYDLQYWDTDGELHIWVSNTDLEAGSKPVCILETIPDDWTNKYTFTQLFGGSDGYGAFSFFDHFTAYDMASRWTQQTDNGSESGTEDVTHTTTIGTITGASGASNVWRSTSLQTASAVVFRARLKFSDEANFQVHGLRDFDASEDRAIIFYDNGSGGKLWQAENEGTATDDSRTQVLTDDYHIVDIKVSATKVLFDMDNTNDGEITSNVPDEQMYVSLGVNGEISVYCDWVLARNYTLNEPTWGTTGSEESRPTSNYQYIRIFGRNLSLSPSLSVATTISRILAIGKTLTSGLTAAVSIQKDIGKIVSTSLSVVAEISARGCWIMSTACEIAASVTVSTAKTFVRAIASSISASTSISTSRGWTEVTSSAISVAAAISRAIAAVRTTASEIEVRSTISAIWSAITDYPITIAANLSVAASVVKSMAWNRLPTPSLSLTVGLSRAATKTRSIATNISIAVSITATGFATGVLKIITTVAHSLKIKSVEAHILKIINKESD